LSSDLSDRLAKQHDVSPRTIRRDARFAESLGELTTLLGEVFKADVLAGKSGLGKEDISAARSNENFVSLCPEVSAGEGDSRSARALVFFGITPPLRRPVSTGRQSPDGPLWPFEKRWGFCRSLRSRRLSRLCVDASERPSKNQQKHPRFPSGHCVYSENTPAMNNGRVKPRRPIRQFRTSCGEFNASTVTRGSSDSVSTNLQNHRAPKRPLVDQTSLSSRAFRHATAAS
jgi:hypothetical protein